MASAVLGELGPGFETVKVSFFEAVVSFDFGHDADSARDAHISDASRSCFVAKAALIRPRQKGAETKVKHRFSPTECPH